MNTRLARLRTILLDQKIDALLISSPANLFYLSGFVCLSPLEREAYLLVTRTHAFLVTSPLYTGGKPDPDISVQVAQPGIHFSELLSDLIHSYNIKSLGIEEQYLTVAEYLDLQQEPIRLKPIIIRTLRMKKDDKEITAITKACNIGDKAFAYILGIIKQGLTEEDLAVALEIFIRQQKATLSFPSIIAFGPHAAIPHHITGNTKLINNQCILLDFGVKVDEYCSDMTRTIFFGTPSEEEKQIYTLVKEAQDASIHYVEKQIAAGEPLAAATIDQQAREQIMKHGYPDFPHCSHGIGLQVHEAPSLSIYSKDTIQEGMVFSVEPGIYQKNHMGVRIEDLMVIHGGKAKLLTHASRELIIIS